MLIPSPLCGKPIDLTSLSRRVNANSQLSNMNHMNTLKLIKKGEC